MGDERDERAVPASQRGWFRRVLHGADRAADPRRRLYRWLGFIGVVAGAATGVVAFIGLFDSAPSEPTIPTFEGTVSHLGDGAAQELHDALEEGDVVELHLSATEGDVVASECAGTFSACSVTWATDCSSIRAADIGDDFSKLIQNCSSFDLRTVDDDGNEVPSWAWRRGAWSLDGFFAVQGTAFNMGILQATVREVPPEVARQIVR